MRDKIKSNIEHLKTIALDDYSIGILDDIQEYIENTNTNEEEEYFKLKMDYWQLHLELSQLADIESTHLKNGTLPIKDIITKQEILKKYASKVTNQKV